MDDHAKPARCVATTPELSFAVRLSTAAVPALLYMLVLDNMARGRFLPAASVILGIYSLIAYWGYRHGLRTTLTVRDVEVERGFGPFRVVEKVPLVDIVETKIPNYSCDLVATLRDGRSLVLVNKHSVPSEPLPDIAFGPEVPGGPKRTTLRFQHLLEQLRQRAQAGLIERRASQEPSNGGDA